MFTGLIETLGTLRRRAGSPVARAAVEARFSSPLALGESLADTRLHPVRVCQDTVPAVFDVTTTADTSATGDHYDSMIQTGIPRGIAWLQQH